MTMAKISSFRCPVTARADNFRALSDNAKEKRTTEAQSTENFSVTSVSQW